MSLASPINLHPTSPGVARSAFSIGIVLTCAASTAAATTISPIVAADRICGILLPLLIVIVDAVVLRRWARLRWRAALVTAAIAFWPAVALSQLFIVWSVRLAVLPYFRHTLIIGHLAAMTLVSVAFWLLCIVAARAWVLWVLWKIVSPPTNEVRRSVMWTGPAIWLLISIVVYASAPVNISLLTDLRVIPDIQASEPLRDCSLYFLKEDGVYALALNQERQVLAFPRSSSASLTFENPAPGRVDLILNRYGSPPQIVIPAIAAELRTSPELYPSKNDPSPLAPPDRIVVYFDDTYRFTIDHQRGRGGDENVIGFGAPLTSAALRVRTHLFAQNFTKLGDAVLVFQMGELVVSLDWNRRTIGTVVKGWQPMVVKNGVAHQPRRNSEQITLDPHTPNTQP